MNQLKAHLRPLQRQGLIDVWYDRDISAGTEWEQEISQHLNAAQMILLLISPDFMNSDYCYGIEMKRALERHERKEARVIPVILRHAYWKVANLDKLQALPTDAKPVMSREWHNIDEAFFDVTEGVRKVVEQVTIRSSSPVQEIATNVGQQAKQITPINPDSFTLLRTLRGHTASVRSIAISADGQIVVSGADDNTIKIWNIHRGDLLRTLSEHHHIVQSIATSPDGNVIASGVITK